MSPNHVYESIDIDSGQSDASTLHDAQTLQRFCKHSVISDSDIRDEVKDSLSPGPYVTTIYTGENADGDRKSEDNDAHLPDYSWIGMTSIDRRTLTKHFDDEEKEVAHLFPSARSMKDHLRSLDTSVYRTLHPLGV